MQVDEGEVMAGVGDAQMFGGGHLNQSDPDGMTRRSGGTIGSGGSTAMTNQCKNFHRIT